MNELTIQTVQFYEDQLQVVGDTREEAFVVLRPACEALGLDVDSQRNKLKAAAWATTAMITAVAEDGKPREMFCLHLDSVPMWLATIQPSRAFESSRPKLERYQREAAKVLAEHFLGRSRSPDGLALAVQALTSALAPLLERVSRVEQLVVQAQALPAQAFIPGHIAKRTSRAITALAKVRTAGRPGAYRAERSGIDTVLRARLAFPAFGGNRWANFPLGRVSELLAGIEDLERQAERLTPVPQQALPFPRPA